MESNYPLRQHLEHKWVKVGRCVYCDTCGIRLYQGTIPKDEAKRAEFVDTLDALMEAAIESQQ